MAVFGVNPGTFQFSGDPVSQALAAKTAQGHRQSQAQENAAMYGAMGNWRAAQEQANAARDTTLYQQPAQFADALAGLYGQYGGAATGALGAYTNPYSQATQAMLGGQAALGRSIGDLYGTGANAIGGVGQSIGGSMGAVGAAAANAMGNIASTQAQMAGRGSDMFGQLGAAQAQLGAAGQTARSNLGSAAMAARSGRDQAALGAAGAIGTGSMSALANMYGSDSAVEQARLNALGAMGSGLNSGAQREASLFNAQGNLGSANQAALGQYGSAREGALANMSIAAANGLGQLGVANYNMQGQMSNALSAILASEAAAKGNAAAAQQAAGPQYAKLQFLSGAMPQLLDTVKYGFQAGPSGGSLGAEIGFDASGPSGPIASGRGGVAPSWGGSRGGVSPPPPTGPIPPPTFAPPPLPDFSAGGASARSFLDSLLARNDQPDSQANQIRSNMMSEFGANRQGILNSPVLASLNDNLKTGYGELASQAAASRSPDNADVQSRNAVIGALSSPSAGRFDSAANTLRSFAGDARSALGGLAASDYAPDYSNLDGALAMSTGAVRDMGEQGRQVIDAGLKDFGGIGAIGGLIDKTYGGMNGLLGSAAGSINSMLAGGVGNINSIADRMDSTFGTFGRDARSAYDSTARGINDNYQQTYGGINDLWSNSLGKVRQFMSAEEAARDDVAASGVRRAAREEAAARDEARRAEQRQSAAAAAEARRAAGAQANAQWLAGMTPANRQIYSLMQNL